MLELHRCVTCHFLRPVRLFPPRIRTIVYPDPSTCLRCYDAGQIPKKDTSPKRKYFRRKEKMCVVCHVAMTRTRTCAACTQVEQEAKKARVEEWKRLHPTLDAASYAAVLAQQHGACAICRQTETATDPKSGKVRRLAVDHDHTTGKIRGLLCAACNRGLGDFKDNRRSLMNAIGYLLRHST